MIRFPNNSAKVYGQSLVELIIWGSLFMLVMLTTPIIAKFGDVKNKHLEVQRYANWERTVWSRDLQSNAELARRADLRIMSHPVQAITATDRTNNPFWSVRGKKILDGEENNVANSQVVLNYEEESSVYKTMAGVFDLEDEGKVDATVTTSIIDRFDTDGNYDEDTTAILAMTSSGEILTNSWSVATNDEFQHKIDHATPLDETIGLMAIPGELGATMLTLPGLDIFFSEAADISFDYTNLDGPSGVSIAVYSEVIDRDVYVKDRPTN